MWSCCAKPCAPLNLKMAATEEKESNAMRINPDMFTLVPERREEVTTEGVLDVAGQEASLSAMVQPLQAAGIPVSLFVDPEATQLQACKNTGACWVELHTGRYADADWSTQPQELARLQEGTAIARLLGMRVNAGNGISYQIVEPIAAIPGMEEINIGHSFVARSVAVGLQQAVRDMKVLVQNPRLDPLFGQAPG